MKSADQHSFIASGATKGEGHLVGKRLLPFRLLFSSGLQLIYCYVANSVMYDVVAFLAHILQADKLMQRIIEILLVIGVLVNLIKGADLILRPHQQRWLQDKCDSLALRLHYTRPIRSMESLHNRLVMIAVGGLIIMGALTAISAYLNRTILKVSLTYNILWVAFVVFCGVFGFLVPRRVGKVNAGHDQTHHNGFFSPDTRVGKALHKFVLKLRDWPIDSPTISGFLLKSLLVVTLSMLVGLTMLVVSFIVFDFVLRAHYRLRFGPIDGFAFLLAGMLISGGYLFGATLRTLIVWMHLAIVGVLYFGALCIMLFIGLFDLLVSVARGVVWRIVEYNKGAFAAIILLATVSLGIAEVYFRMKSMPPPAAIAPGTSQSPNQP